MNTQAGRPDCPIVITGPMGAGKTRLGRALAGLLELPFRDSDEHLTNTTQGTQETAREIAARHGVTHLHELERRFVIETVADPQPAVIAAAASIADDPALLATIVDSGCVLVILDPPPAAIGRDAEAAHRRPIPTEEAQRLHRERLKAARDAGAAVITVDRSFAEDLAAIVAAIRRW